MRYRLHVLTVMMLGLFAIGFGADRLPLAEYFTNTG